MKKCNHSVGFLYGHEESSFIGKLVSESELCLHTIEDLNNSDSETFKYCPGCGRDISNLIEKAKEKLLKLKKEEEIKKQKEIEKREIVFNEKVEKVKNSLSLLNEKDSYLLRLKKDKNNYGQEGFILLAGQKHYIAKNIVHNQRFFNNLEININSLTKLPSVEEFHKILLNKYIEVEKINPKEGFNSTTFKFNNKKYSYVVSYDPEGGLIYTSEEFTDEFGDQNSECYRDTPISFCERFNIEYSPEKVI